MATANKESERLIAIRHNEQQKIERQLTTLFPERFSDLCDMLELATVTAADGCMTQDAEIEMLRDVRAGLSSVWQKEMATELEKAPNEGTASTRRNIDYVFQTDDIIDHMREERASA
jgi:hypothetical protein